MSHANGARRVLVINGDDFGQTDGINAGIIEAYERGVLTSASLMVRWKPAAAATAYARSHPDLSVGLHFDIGEWVWKDGDWRPLYQVLESHSEAALAQELDRQLAAFDSLMGRPPTHLDSHQHVHRNEPLRSLLARVAQDLKIPLRNHTRGIRYCGEFYGQTNVGDPLPDAITPQALAAIIGRLSPGITEIGCHPGRAAGQDMVYSAEREQELEALCHPSVREQIQSHGIELCSFSGAAVRSAILGRES